MKYCLQIAKLNNKSINKYISRGLRLIITLTVNIRIIIKENYDFLFSFWVRKTRILQIWSRSVTVVCHSEEGFTAELTYTATDQRPGLPKRSFFISVHNVKCKKKSSSYFQ